MSTPAKIADALVLAFTRGLSLKDWDRLGLTDREWGIYERLAPHYGRTVFVTYGGPEEAAIARRLSPGLVVVCNEAGLAPEAFEAQIPERVETALEGTKTVVVKTNQMEGGPAAVRITTHLRRAGRRVGLVARGGFLWSRFVAAEHGAATPGARRAADIERELCRAADVVIASSPEMADDLTWRYALPHERAVVVPNYVVAEIPAPFQDREGFAIMYAGQLVARKRVDVLIHAAARLPEPKRSQVVLWIVGDGPEEDRLRQLAAGCGVETRFEPRLPHRQLLERMARCTIYAQASRLEGHPKTVIEAMAIGAPVVVADGPGLADVVTHCVTGMCVPGHAAAFAGAIDGLLNDAEWREALGQAAARHALQTWGLERVEKLEAQAHRNALERAGAHAETPIGDVRWEPALLQDPVGAQVDAWERSLRGFARRLEPERRVRFVAAVDAPLYRLQGEAAVEQAGGLHPKHRLTRYHDFFAERIKPTEHVIDLGCGVGALAAAIAERTRARVTGMDWTAEHLDQARARALAQGVADRTHFVAGDITRDRAPGVPSGTGFDAVVLSNVLEHLADRPALLRKWREWYGARRFLIRVPAFDREWRVPWKRELGVEWRLDPTHETEYTADQLRAELREAGLEPAETIIRWGEYWVEARAR